MPPSRLALLVLATAAAISHEPPSRAHAQAPCGRAGRPWVSLVFVGDGFIPSQRESITADLRAGLRLRGIDVCALGAEGSEPPLALVQLGSAASSSRVSVSIDVHDAVTEKRVLRDVDLRRVTPDGHTLRVAQAAEELLRASWAELALADAPAPAVPPPVEVTRSVVAASHGRERDRLLGMRVAGAHHGAGTTWLGGEAFVALWPTARLGAELSFGLRQGLQQDAAHGSIDAGAVGGALSVCVALLPRGEFVELSAKLGTALSRVRFSGRGDADVSASERALLAASARATLALHVWITRALALSLDVGPGLPLRAAIATDSGDDVAGTAGIELHGALGLGASF